MAYSKISYQGFLRQMEIRRYAEVVWRRKWPILITTLTALAIATLGSILMAPVYSASTTMRIVETRSGTIDYSDVAYAQRLQNTYVSLLGARPTLEAVIKQLNLRLTPDDLAGQVKVEAVPATELIRVTASSGDPREAASIADTVIAAAPKQLPPAFSVVVVEPAVPPGKPDRPRPELYVPLGALAGLVGGLGLALLLENLDTRLYSAESAAAAFGTPLLGWVPKFRRRKKGRASTPSHDAGTVAAMEAFRGLSASVLARVADLVQTRYASSRAGSVLLIAGPEPRTGRSTVVANLAAAMARAGTSVVAVGTDLRHDDLGALLGVSEEPARATTEPGPDDVDDALVDTPIPGVRVLPSASLSIAGNLPRQSSMRSLLASLTRIADVVLLDSPAVLASADAATLAPLADGIVLVAARGRTTERNLELAREQLNAAGGRVLGLVFNQAAIPSDGNFFTNWRWGSGRGGPDRSAAERRQSTQSPNGAQNMPAGARDRHQGMDRVS